jgi:hypothetical protein
MSRGARLGPFIALSALPMAAVGLFLRTGPAEIPWAVKPLFALLAVVPVTLSALFTGVVPLILLLLGLVMGLVTAVGVAYGWQQFGEEADPG